MEQVDTDGVRIAFQRSGSGPALVLVHGAMTDSRCWSRELDTLSDTFDVIAWDAPGHGASDDPTPVMHTLGGYAAALSGFLDSIGVGRAHVLGHSFGGALALAFASLFPARVGSLVIAGGYAGWAGSLEPDEVAARLAFARQAADALDRGEPVSQAQLPGLWNDGPPPEMAEELAAIDRDLRASGARAGAEALATADLRATMPQIDVPVLVLSGAADLRSPPAVADALVALLPRARVSVIPKAGHQMLLEAPAACEAEVRRFLTEEVAGLAPGPSV